MSQLQLQQKTSKQSSSSDQSNHQAVQIESLPSSQKELSQYLRYLPALNQTIIQQKRQLLEANGFTHLQGKFQKFEAMIIQTNKQMIIYQVTFGEYRTQISAFCANLAFEQKRQIIGSGQFGQVVAFKIQDNEIVAKCIKKPQRTLYPSKECLKEIFMVKFASVLGIGPLYHKAYLYDILVLKNHCEFLMQRCFQPNYENQTVRKKLQKDILEALRTLHSFKAVHMDIKPNNIAYSQQFKKYILIDFGFTEMIEEGAGEKTWIRSKGTYCYMSKEMKIATQLNEKCFIDLYDNDLYGLKETFKTRNSLQPQKKKAPQHHTMNYQWSEYIPYFKASFYHAICNYSEFQRLVLSDRNLPFCIRRLVRKGDLDEKTKTRYVKYLNSICSQKYKNKEYDEILDLKCADSELYIQLSKAESESLESYDKDIKNLETLFYKEQKQFAIIWRKKAWIDQIFKLLFLKKKMPNNQRELKQRLIDFIYEQRPFADDQKGLQVIKTFQEVYTSQRNTTKLLQIQYLYESAGLYKDGEMLGCQIWEMIFRSGNELLVLLHFKLIFCQFIFSQLDGLQWNLKIPADLRALIQRNTVFDVCIRAIDEMKNINEINQYCKPSKQTFYGLWGLFGQLENLLEEEKARMVLLRLRQLALHLEYNLIDICYMATNKHIQKYDIEQKIKADLKDPIFKFKLDLLAFQNDLFHFFHYATESVSLLKLNNRITKFYTSDIPFLSEIQTIWHFADYSQTQNFQKMIPIFKSIASNFVTFRKFVTYFQRHIIKAFKNSEECFRIFLESLQSLIGLQQPIKNVRDQLILVNILVLITSQFWDSLYWLKDQEKKVKELTQIYLLVSEKLSSVYNQSYRQSKQSIDDQNMITVCKLSEYLQNIGQNLLSFLRDKKLIQDLRGIQLLKDLSFQPRVSPCLDACFKLFEMYSKFFSPQLQRQSKSQICRIFTTKECLEFSMVYLNSKLVPYTIIKHFLKKKLYIELQKFEIRLSFQLKSTKYLKVRNIYYNACFFTYASHIPQNCITQLCNYTLRFQSLQSIYNNSILVFIIYRSLKLVKPTLQLEVQKRLVVLISHGLPLFIGQQMKRQIRGYILNIQILLNQQWGKRKKLINFKRQRIAREISLLPYKEEVMMILNKRANKREEKRVKYSIEKQMMKILKAKMKSIKMSDPLY